MHKYQHRRHNKNLLMAHIIFATKYRKPILVGSIREDVMPTDSITKIVNRLKQHTTWRIWKTHHKKLSYYYWKEHTFWSDGYFAASIGEVSQSTIEHYIENQG